MRTWQSTLRVFLVAAWTIAAVGCVYYNMFFNAKKKFELAEKQTQTATGAVGSPRFGAGYRGYEEAIERFSRVIERYPKSKWVDDAYYYIGLGYFRMGEYNKSERAFREIRDNHPKSKYTEEVSFWLAVCRVRQGETLAGREHLRKLALEAQKKRWRSAAWYELGELFLEEKEYDSAAAAYLTVADQYSGEQEAADARFKAGEAFRLAGRQEQALEQFRLSLRGELVPEQLYRTRMRMADAYFAQNQIDTGLILLEGLAKDSRYADSLGVLRLKIGVGLEKARRFDEAVTTYEEVVEKFPKTAWSAEAYYHIGYINQKEYFDFVKAREFYQKAKDEFARSEYAQKAVELSVTMANIEGYREEISPKQAAPDSTDTSKAANPGEPADSGSVDTQSGPLPLLEESDSTVGVDTAKNVNTEKQTAPVDSVDSSASHNPLPTDTVKIVKTDDLTTAVDSADLLLSHVLPAADTTASADTTNSLASQNFPPADTASHVGTDPTGMLRSVKRLTLPQDAPGDTVLSSTASDALPNLDTTWIFDTLMVIDTLVVVDTAWSFDTMYVNDSLVAMDTMVGADSAHMNDSALAADAARTSDTARVKDSALAMHIIKTPDTARRENPVEPMDTPRTPDTARVRDSVLAMDTTGTPDTARVSTPLLVVDTTMAFDSSVVVDTTFRYDTTLVFDTAAVAQAERAAQAEKAAEEQRAAEQAKLATAYFKLAEAYHTILDAPDSALYYYDALVERFPKSEHVPRALFASASILEEDSHDTAAAAERYRRVLDNYGHTDYAGAAIQRLGLAGTPADTGYPAAAYQQAERMLLDEGRPESARVLFDRVVREYPGSLYAPMAAYASAVVADQMHNTEDSTVWYLYKQVIDSFPSTPYAAAAKTRIGEGTGTPRRERQRVVLAETPQTEKVDSALAAIKAEQGDTTSIRLPRAPQPQKTGEFVYPQSELGSEPWKGSVMFKIWVDLTGRISEYEMVMPSQRQDIDLNAEAAVKETFFNPDSIPPESLNMWYLYEVRVIPPAQKPENIFNDPLQNIQ